MLASILSAAGVVGCGSSNSSPTSPGPTPAPGGGGGGTAADVMITINGMDGSLSFSPGNASVKAGQTVAWKNADSITHAIAQDGGGFSTSSIGPGATSAPITVSTTGNMPYHCSIHPTMTGALTVN
jgi:plastocyanin